MEPKDLIIQTFNQGLGFQFDTKLIDEGTEPIYQPAQHHGEAHKIFFAHGYWSSALHELAHWCIAGSERRKLLDYGYWYKPNRSQKDDRQRFLQSEARPQALEWHFTVALGQDFFVSLDDFSNDQNMLEEFRRMIRKEAIDLHQNSLPPRAQVFVNDISSRLKTFDQYRSFWNQACSDLVLPR